jgi:hypothetical protein
MQNEKDYFMDEEKQIDVIKLIKPFKTGLTDKQVEILITLSDNKGHAAHELAKAIGSQESYVSALLKELSSDEFGSLIDSFSIQSFHLKDPIFLVRKLQESRDPISKYIFNNMSDSFKENFSSPDLRTVSTILALGLDGFLIDVNLFNRERFSGIKLSEYATKLLTLKENLKPGSIRILNRILIEDAYPDELCKTRTSLIHQILRPSSTDSKLPYFINPDLRTFYLIVDHLTYEIRLDESRLAVMDTRLNGVLSVYSGFGDLFISRSELEKGIKDGKYDMIYYKARYAKKINNLWKFMTSNYVGELMKKCGYKEILRVDLPDEFDYQKFLEISGEKGYISQEELNELKQLFSQGFGAN